jgi:hypothetical protein
MLPPPYVVAAKIHGVPIAHRWGDTERAQSLGDENRRLDRELQSVSLRGLLVLSGSLLAWMAERFDSITPSSDRLSSLAVALWAANVDRRYLNEAAIVPVGDDASSPIEAPIDRAIEHVATIVELYDDGENAIVDYVAALAYTVRIVVPARSAFDKWFKAAVNRLAHLAARTDPVDAEEDDYDDPILVAGMYGTALPFDAVDPDAPNVIRLIDASEPLTLLNPATNPFLHTAAMVQRGGP